MTLLTIAQNVADYVGVDRPPTVIGNTDDGARRLLSLARSEGKRLARRNTWEVLQKENEFSTVNGTASYSLPSDYDRPLGDTAWDRTNYWAMRGPLSPAQWQVRKSAIVAASTVRRRWRIKPVSGTKEFFVDPTPTSADTLVFEYVSNQWCQSSGGAGQTTWQADSDVGILDEELMELGVRWRFLNRLGMAYLEEKDEYDRAVDQAIASENTGKIDFARTTPELLEVNLPETGFGGV